MRCSSPWWFQIDVLQKTNERCEDVKNSLQQELETREQRLQQELRDKRRMEQHLNEMMENSKMKWAKECVSQTRRVINALQGNLGVSGSVSGLSLHRIAASRPSRRRCKSASW